MQKEIKIFLASSEELKDDRNAFGDLIRVLDGQFEKRGLRVRLLKWEDLHLLHNGIRTQDRYNEIIKECDIFVSLFYTKAGAFTLEEVTVAENLLKTSGSPELDYFFKSLNSNQIESEGLADFRKKIEEKEHYFYSSYADIKLLAGEKLRSRFIDVLPDIKLYNSRLYMGDVCFAEFNELSCAANNKELQELKENKEDKLEQIDDLTALLNANHNPKYEKRREILKQEVFELTQKIDKIEETLLSTAISIIDMQSIKSNQRLKEAAMLFNSGKIQEALSVLDIDTITADADKVVDEMQKGQEAIKSMINELLARVTYIMNETDNPNRIELACQSYDTALKYAQKALINNEGYIDLLIKYGTFCKDHQLFDKCVKLFYIALEYQEKLLGEEHPDTTKMRQDLGEAYFMIGDYNKAKLFISEAISVQSKSLPPADPSLLSSYISLGNIYYHRSNYYEALDVYQKILKVQERSSNVLSSTTITTMCYIARVKLDMDDNISALEYLHKALVLSEELNGKAHPDTGMIYGYIGGVHQKSGEYIKAIEYICIAIVINEKSLGNYHVDTIKLYNNLGNVYFNLGDYNKAIELYSNIHKFDDKIFGENPILAAKTLRNIGLAYSAIGDCDTGHQYFHRAIDIQLKVLGEEHPDVADTYVLLGQMYDIQGNYAWALEYYLMALPIYEKSLGIEHPDYKRTDMWISEIKATLQD